MKSSPHQSPTSTARAFEDLSQSLRVLLEARIGANGLFKVDFCEAVGNIESGITSVLNAFHSLYDAMQKDRIEKRIDWYDTPELALILALRNARHHNICSKIRTLFRFHLETVFPPEKRTKYLMVDFEAQEEDATTFDVPLSLGDLIKLTGLPKEQSRLRSAIRPMMENYLNTGGMIGAAASKGVSEQAIFFNVTPLIVNAGIAIRPHISDHIRRLSSESKIFDSQFQHVLPCWATKHRYEVFDFWKP